MLNITNFMSTLTSSSEKLQASKEALASTAILKNNMSSISVKNKNTIEQIEN